MDRPDIKDIEIRLNLADQEQYPGQIMRGKVRNLIAYIEHQDKRIERLGKALSPFAAFEPDRHWMFYSLHRKPQTASEDGDLTRGNMQWRATLSDEQAADLNVALAELEETPKAESFTLSGQKIKPSGAHFSKENKK